MDIHGYPWISMDVHGCPWISMDIHGYPCISKPRSFRTRKVAKSDGGLLKITLGGQKLWRVGQKQALRPFWGPPSNQKRWSVAQKRAFGNSQPDPADPPEVVAGPAARTPPSTRAGGQDHGFIVRLDLALGKRAMGSQRELWRLGYLCATHLLVAAPAVAGGQDDVS